MTAGRVVPLGRKPRLYLKDSVWSCVSVREVWWSWSSRLQMGYGYSPGEAYLDWANQ